MDELIKVNQKYPGKSESAIVPTRMIVCGGKDFKDYGYFEKEMDSLIQNHNHIELVSGHAKGADTFAEIFAGKNAIPIKVFPPDWKKYGKAAGPIRNREMLTYASEARPVVVAFWNGKSRGIGNMLKQANEAGVECHIFMYDR